MALQTFDIGGLLASQKPDYSGLANAVQNYYAGKKASTDAFYQPQLLESEIGQRLANTELAKANTRYTGLKSDYYPRLTEAQISELSARAEKERMGGDLTGTAGNILKLDRLEKHGKIDSDTAAKIRYQLELEQKREKTLEEYQSNLNKTLMFRSSTPLQKQQMELKALEEGRGYTQEGETYELQPKEQSRRIDSHMMDIIQKTTDPAWRAKMGNMRNMHTTLMSINPDDAFRYSGGLGGVASILNKGGALIGQQSEDYKRFEENLAGLNLLSDQASQYFDIPAAKEIQRRVHELTDPNSWFRTPETSKRKYDALVKLFEKEAANTMQAGTNPAFYNTEYQKDPIEGMSQPVAQAQEDFNADVLISNAGQIENINTKVKNLNSKYPEVNIEITDINETARKNKTTPEDVLARLEKYLEGKK